MKQKYLDSFRWKQVQISLRKGLDNSRHDGKDIHLRYQPRHRTYNSNPFTSSGNIWCSLRLYLYKEYSNYLMLPFLSTVAYYCDNLEVVHKINTLANNPNFFNEQHTTTDHDAVLQLKLCLPPNIIAFHVKGHQNKWK